MPYLPTIAFVDELVRCGLRELCFAPGSRSTPLALLFAERSGIRLIRHIDERCAGFFALGMAKAAGRPVGLLCTSGTAAANFLPAVVEAYFGQVPLIVLTADRPPEARGVGSPQTIDQVKLYGGHVKWFVEMPVPEAREELVDHARAMARRAFAVALEAPAGPVHLNFPFREPLLPPERPFEILAAKCASPAHRVRVHSPHTAQGTGAPSPLEAGDPSPQGAGSSPPPGADARRASRRVSGRLASALRSLAERLAGARRGLIVCGPQGDPALGEAAVRLAARLGFPVLADPLSQVRCGPHAKDLVVDAYDAFLRDERFAARVAPEVVLQFGAPPTSKALTQYLDRHRCLRFLIEPAGWRDPSHRAEALRDDPVAACLDLEAFVAAGASAAGPTPGAAQSPSGTGSSSSSPLPGDEWWLRLWQDVNQAARRALTAWAASGGETEDGLLFEGRVFCELAEILPAGAALYAGNSMPVRDLDTFFPALDRPVRFFANRGANGIDGVLSSALGASAAWEGPLVLVVGDLSFLHDLTGLYAAKAHGLSATVVLIHNDGGGIFSFLPQASRPAHFEELFGAPTGLDFRPAVEMFGAAFVPVRRWSRFRQAVQESLRAPGVHVIEVRSDRRRNVEYHRRAWQVVSEAIAPILSRALGGVDL